MKVLHYCGVQGGGAWLACKRLNAALCKRNVDSTIFNPLQPFQMEHFSTGQRKALVSFVSRTSNTCSRTLGLFGGMNVVHALNASDADLIHLHVPEIGIPIHAIPHIQKKIVWTLHDSWAFCGTEQHPNIREHDQRYKEGYNAQNFPATSSRFDLDKWIWLWKKHCWKDLKAHFIAPSQWEAACFEESALFRGQKCHVIPNYLDTKIFYPRNKQDARKKLHLPDNKKILLFGADSIKNKVKGIHLLPDILKRVISVEKDLFLVGFGKDFDPSFLPAGIQFLATGRIEDESEMAELYSAADVFICPSLAENAPYTCMESVACGTPVAAFAIGGIPDLVQQHGHLAAPYDLEDFANGIRYCLHNIQAFIPEDCAEQSLRLHMKFYNEILQ